MAKARLADGVPKIHKNRHRMWWYDVEGKRKEAYGGTPREAYENAAAKVDASNNAAAEALVESHRPAREVLFRDFTDDFIAACRVGRDGETKLTSDTILSYESYLKCWINPALGDQNLSDITGATIRKFRSALLQADISRNTATRIISVTKVIFRYAVTEELIEKVPGQDVTVKKDWGEDHDERVERIHSDADIKRIEAAALSAFRSSNKATASAYRRWYPLFLILRSTGIRISEAIALKWSDFGDGYKTVNISRSVARPRKGKPQADRVQRPKTKNAYRTIPVHPYVREVLTDWRKECMICPDDWVFPTRDGHALNYSNVRTKFWLPLIENSKVEDLGMHSLRHYFVSVLVREGRIKEASTLAGHASVAFTLDQYGHMIPNDEETMDMVTRIVGGGFGG